AELEVVLGPHRAGARAVVNERPLVATPTVDVQVDRVVAGVELASQEPAIEGPARVVEDSVPASIPVDVFRGRGPEAIRVPHRPRVCLAVDALRHRSILLPPAARRPRHVSTADARVAKPIRPLREASLDNLDRQCVFFPLTRNDYESRAGDIPTLSGLPGEGGR